jgi:hypothetical protein
MDQVTCDCCKITYNDRWIEDNKCLFCIKFVPMADRKKDIMMQIEYHFMYGSTGEYSRVSYYKKYLDYLNTWCIKWNIPSNTEDKEFEESLRKVNDWTREYWH